MSDFTRNAAILSAVAFAVSMATATHAADAPKSEKCYGVVKASKNDCKTNSNSCAGSAKVSGQKDAWLYLPAGTCEKIVGGSLSAKS